MIALLAAAAALATFRDCADCPEMRLVPAGSFTMGSSDAETAEAGLDPYFADREKPRRKVAVGAFALATTEVTRGAFAAFVAESGYQPERGCFVFEGSRWRLDSALGWDAPGFAQGADEPAVCLSRRDAERYAGWLSARTGRAYRLPSEAEWEYAARASTTTPYPWGPRFAPDGCRFANAGDEATQARFGWAGKSMNLREVPPWRPVDCDDGFAATAPVGRLAPNAWGLYDMLGNAQEWVADCLNPSHAGAEATAEARRTGDCTRGILKGQGWTGTANVLRPAFRLNGPAAERRFSWGFRLAAATEKTAAAGPPAAASPDATTTHATLAKVAGVARSSGPPLEPLPGVDWSWVDAIGTEGGAFALLVWQGGALRHERYWDGATNASRPEPASMAKTVLALAIGQAVTRGRIPSIDAPIERWLPEWRGDGRGSITLRHLLSMRSGLAPLSRNGGAASPVARFHSGEEMVALMLGQPLAHAPEGVFEYQNTSSQLACLILERATGERYADFLSKSLWRPLGAGDAYLWLDKASRHPRCYASLFARPRDWLKLGLLLKNRGRIGGRRIVRAAWIDAMATAAPDSPNFGLHLWRLAPHAPQRFYNQARTDFAVPAAAPALAADTLFVDGYGGQRVYISRALDLVVVRLGRTDPAFDDTRLLNAVVRAVVREGRLAR